jgi:hypothetical protein
MDSLGQALFGSAGWLFADLMLALTMAFLVANTVIHPAPPVPKPAPAPTSSPTPSPSPSARPEPALDLSYVTVQLTVDSQGLLNNDPNAMASVRKQIRAKSTLNGRHAGLVLAFDGDNGDPSIDSTSLEIAGKVNEVLASMGSQGYVFRNTAYRSFIGRNVSPDIVDVDIYLFKQ